MIDEITEINTIQMRQAIEAMIRNEEGMFADEYYRNREFSDYEIRQLVFRVAIKNMANDGGR